MLHGLTKPLSHLTNNLCVTFLFTSGHLGVKVNERSDSLASKATMAGCQAMDQTNILNAIRNSGQTGYSGFELNSKSLAKLMEAGVI